MAGTLIGLDKVQQKLLELARDFPNQFAAALYQEGLALEADSTKRVPVDTGRLRATHYVAPPQRSGDRIVCEVGYGTEYAIYVHERTEVRHQQPGEAQFLKKAFEARAEGFRERLARRTRRWIDSGAKGVEPLPSTQVPTSPQDPGEEHSAAVREERSEAFRKARAERRQKRADRFKQVKERRRERRRLKAAARREKRKARHAAKVQRRADRRAEKRYAKNLRKQHRLDARRAKKLAKRAERRAAKEAAKMAKRAAREAKRLERERTAQAKLWRKLSRDHDF